MDIPNIKTLDTVELESNELLENLTGGQIQEVLDYLILQSLSPIVRNSNVFDAQVIYLLSLVTKNRKRKLSALPREEFISVLCQYLATKDVEKKITLLETAKIERGFLYNFVVNILKKLDGFLPVYQQSLICTNTIESIRLSKKLEVMAKEIGIPKDRVYCVYTQSTDYLSLSYKFRNSIVNNYVRYSYKQAKIFCASKSNHFDFQDVWHNFLAAVIKAIDKYDCSKGALTSYIKWWILNVQTSASTDYGHEYGIAYSIPQLQRKGLALKDHKASVNFGLSLETILGGENAGEILKDFVTKESGLEVPIENDEELELIKYLVKKADLNGGIARLYLDVEEFFSKKERRKMARITLEQLGANRVKLKNSNTVNS
jgi:hypothetical protein